LGFGDLVFSPAVNCKSEIADMNDLRYAFRQLLKNPGFTAVAVLSLSLGIAANTTIFTFVNVLLLRPPPVEAPGELWQVWRQNLKGGSVFERYQGLSYPGYVHFRDNNQSFATLAAFDPETPFVSWSRDGIGQSVQCQFVSGNFFNTCGIGTTLGRAFGPQEDRQPGADPVAVVSQSNAGQNEARSESIKFSVVSEIEGRHPGFGGRIMLIAALALGASGLVLLIACANVANLLLARATARSREIVIRLAMGASRWRILRQLLTESMLLALLGGALGLLLALWGAELMRISHPFLTSTPEILLQPIVVDFSPDWRVFNWALAVSLLTGLLFGLAPAWHAARTNLVPALKNEEGGTGRGARRFGSRHVLVIAQLAISVVVLASAGPFVKRLYQAQVAEPGFQSANLLSVRLDPGLVGYDAAKARLFFTELVRQVETLPGVRTALLAYGLPFAGGEMVV
jgi:hypothetical protein